MKDRINPTSGFSLLQREILGLSEAMAALGAMLETAARDYNGPVAVAVLDEQGSCVASARMDGCTFHNVEFAFKKAYTAVYFGQNSSAMQKQMNDRGRRAGDFGNPNLLFMSGGAVVKRPGSNLVLGGVGVSGLSGQEDEEIALAGLKAMGLSS